MGAKGRKEETPPLLGYLGPAGTFSEAAADLYRQRRASAPSTLAPLHEAAAAAGTLLPPLTDKRAYSHLPRLLAAVAAQEIAAAIVPLENSLEGSVNLTLDTLVREERLYLYDELILPIHHCLAGLPGLPSDAVPRLILSHPQALAQCYRYLTTRFPEAELQETASTAAAAAMVRERNDPGLFAVCPAPAAALYGLTILATEIADGEENTTRFVVVACHDHVPTGKDKTSLVVGGREDHPGILYAFLHEFATRAINLTRIESRPSRRCLGDYIFFIDCLGHRWEPQIQEALAAVAAKASFFRILGSYPLSPNSG